MVEWSEWRTKTGGREERREDSQMREWPGGPDAEKGKRGEAGKENGETCESRNLSLQQGLLELKWEREVARKE
jgi:hypothetical protein